MTGGFRSRRQRICSWCSKSFTKDEHLARHVRTHTREKPFPCPICRKAFSRHDSLLRHSRCHQESRPHTGAGHNPECGALNAPEQRSSPRQNSIDIHGCSTPRHQLSSIGPSNPKASDFRSVSYSVSNPALRRTTLLPNVEELAQVRLDGVAGFPTPGSQSNLTEPDPRLDIARQDDSWMFANANTEMPAWFADDDFDLTALNSEIFMSTAQWYPPGADNQWHQPLGNNPPPFVEDMLPSREELVQTHWYTFMGTSPTGQTTPETGMGLTRVDEAYRTSLAAKLQPHIPFLALPSTDFLNLCVQMYFTKFHRVFPIVHAPTFRPSSKSSLLLLSICSIGSLFVGSSHAASQGVKVFETLNKAILSSWERHFSKQGPETIAMIQAALIGQTFGLLSGRKKDLLTAETFHGTLVVWARRATTFKCKEASDYINSSEILDAPEKVWKRWIQAEEQNRLLAGIHVHDVEISELFLTDPYLRHSPGKLPLLCDDDLWDMTTVEDWRQRIMIHTSGSNPDIHETSLYRPELTANGATVTVPGILRSGFHTYLELEELAASATEGKNTDDPAQQKTLENALVNFHTSYIRPSREHATDPYCLLVLWHSIFFSLYANISRLELVIGKEGLTEAENHVGYVRSWASSPDGQCCALHAALILRELERENIGTEPPMHVPRILFRAALIWFCYTRFGTDTADLRQSLQFSALQRIGVNCQRLLFEANGFKVLRPTTSESSTFSGLLDLLSRVGHWGISQLMGSILNLLLPKDERHTT
ncbi:hypothetical protein N7490_009841 [Penicillium lividum]|nr:hypothetical protein N7490_009841 [Penicillium lividum]